MDGYNPTLLDFGMSSEILVGETTGTKNYDKLYNAPIKNLVGTEDAPVALPGLISGNYSISGFFMADALQQTDVPINVHVIGDENASLVYYFVLSNLDLTLVLLKFEEGQLVMKKTRSMTGDVFEDF